MSDLANEQLHVSGTFWLKTMGTQLSRWFARSPGSHTEVGPGGWIALSKEAYIGFNVSCVLDRPGQTALFERYANLIGRVPASVLVQRLSPELIDAAADAGARDIGQIPFMAWEGGKLERPPGPLVIRRAANPGDIMPAAVLVAESFSANLQACINVFEPMAHGPHAAVWIGELDGHIVCTAVTLHDERTAGIYCLATTRPLRRQGYAGAFVRQVMARCLSNGDQRFYLHTTPFERNFSEEIGFRPVAWHHAFLLNDETDRTSRLAG